MLRLSFLSMIAFAVITSVVPVQFLSAEEMTLDDCVSIALQESEKVKASGMSAAMAKYDAEAALISAFPKMYIEAQVLKLDFSGIAPMEFGGVAVSIPMPEYSKEVSITLVQPVSQLYAIQKGYAIKNQITDIELLKTEAAKNQEIIRIIDFYYNYQLLSRLKALFTDISSQLDNYTKLTENLIANEIAGKESLYRLDVEKAKNKKDIEQAQSNLEVLKKGLSLHMNRDMESFTIASENEETKLPAIQPFDDLLRIQKEHRPEMRMLPHAEIIAEKARKVAWQPIIPSLAFMASYTRKFDPPVMNAENNYVFGAVMSWDIGLDWWKSERNIKKAMASEQKTLLESVDARKQMELQVFQMYSSLRVKEKEILLASAEIQSAGETLRIEENKYKENMTTQTELINAHLSLKGAKTKLISAQIEYRKTLEILAATMGIKGKDMTVSQ